MPVNQIKRNGSYAPLSAHYYKDDRIAMAGEAAELLYLRGLAFCADVIQDGFISELQVSRHVGVGLRGLQKRVETLVRLGLWERVEDGLFDNQHSPGYRVTAWHKWNLTRAEIREKQRKDAERKANGR